MTLARSLWLGTSSQNLIFLDFHVGVNRNNDDYDDFYTQEAYTFQALLKRDDYTGNHYKLYQKCLHKGTKLQVTGRASPTDNPGNVVLTIHSMKLITVPRQVQHIETILRQFLIAKDATANASKENDPAAVATYLLFQQQVSTACGFDSLDDLYHKINEVRDCS